MDIISERTFHVPKWDDATRKKTIEFWVKRGVVFSEPWGSTLVGNRGSQLAGFFSSSMGKLTAKLAITVSFEGDVHSVLSITVGKYLEGFVTEPDREHGNLELETFESFLLRGDELTEKWKQFRKSSVEADLSMALKLSLLGKTGRSISLKWYEWIWYGFLLLVLMILIIGGGLLGVFCGVAAALFNVRVFQSGMKPVAKWLLSGGITLVAVIVYLALEVVVNYLFKFKSPS
jgi:hypothetical protein